VRFRAGFTLLEVLIALIIVSLALFALTRTAALEVSNFDAVRIRTLGGWVAANVLAETRIAEPLPALGQRDGQLTFSGRAWRWQLNVQNTPDAAVRRLDVAVFVGDEKQSTVTLTGFSSDQPKP